MATKWMTQILAGLNDGTLDAFNTKEDFEVLNGLFIGRTAHKQLNDVHSIKQMKMWDTL